MNAEKRCNMCWHFGHNGLTNTPCNPIPSRKCPYFKKIPNKQYIKIVQERIRKHNEKVDLKEQEEVKKIKNG